MNDIFERNDFSQNILTDSWLNLLEMIDCIEASGILQDGQFINDQFSIN